MVKKRIKYYDALRSIYLVLGPSVPKDCENKCFGCRYEMEEAIEIVRKALKIRKGKQGYRELAKREKYRI